MQSDHNMIQDRGQLNLGNIDLDVDVPRIWRAIQGANQPVRLFQSLESVVRLELDKDGEPKLQHIDAHRLATEISRVLHLVRVDHKGNVKYALPPDQLMNIVLKAPSRLRGLPELVAITRVPTLARGYFMVENAGYHTASGILYIPTPNLDIPSVPRHPDRLDVANALSLIDELIGQFPFAGAADKATAIAFMINIFVRYAIDGPSPLHMFEASTPGTGKTKLASVALIVALGHVPLSMPAPNDDDEWRKVILSALLKLPQVVFIDNVNAPLISGALAQVLSTEAIEGRLLGGNTIATARNSATWIATANNPTMSADIARRSVRCRLDATVERPWQRTGFKHPDLPTWALNHRAELVWACLTLINNWIAEGRPSFRGKPLGGFEQWSFVHGGILEAAGIRGFLENLDEFYDQVDTESDAWSRFVIEWANQGDHDMSIVELFGIARGIDGFNFSGASERAQQASFGKSLAQRRDQIIAGHRLKRSTNKRSRKPWRLLEVASSNVVPMTQEFVFERTGTDDAPF